MLKNKGMGARKILIVDDELDILRVVVFRLKKAGYEVITAGDGKSGLDLAREEKPDLILLDWRLPVMDGVEVCRRIKEDDNLKKIPVIFLTASMAGEIENKKKEFGAEGYIIKPFEPSELLERVKNQLAE